MGKRARRGGLTNAVLRSALTRKLNRDEDAHAIAQRVYVFAVEHKQDEGEPLPLHIWAPVQVAAEQAAPGAAKLAGLPTDEPTVLDVAAYLLAGFREMVIALDTEHFRAWQEKMDALPTGDVAEPETG